MKQILTLMSLTFFATAYTQNKAGTLDSSFGVNGKIVAVYPEAILYCFDAGLQSDGKIVCAGSNTSVARFKNDGIIDSGFGVNGSTYIDFGSDYTTNASNAILIQPDDKIITVGYAVTGIFEETNRNIAIARLNINGSLDSSFGTNGTLIADYGLTEAAYDVAIQPDGKIIIQASGSGNFITLRYLQDGTPDESFGNAGRVVTVFPGLVFSRAVVLQQDGKIIAAGSDDKKALMVRYMPNGTIDNTFGTNGIVKSDLTAKMDFIADAVLQPDGKIIIAGSTSQSFSKGSTLLARYNINGSLDSSFGTKGITIYEIDYSTESAKIKLQPDGKIITAGSAFYNFSPPSFFLAERFSKNGIPDSSFGTNGYTITEISIDDYASGLILQENNKILLAGYTTYEGKPYIAFARYNNDASPIPIARIKRWLRKHGITWEDCPPSICNNITGYAVQRSPNGINWSTVFRSPLTAHRSLPTNSYADPSPLPGTNYYRLQTTSVDGAVAYSNVIAINNELSVISISPNPARSVLRIDGLPSNQKIKITIVDIAGNVAMNYAPLAIRPSSINISQLKPGNYLLRVETEGEVITRQFVKE